MDALWKRLRDAFLAHRSRGAPALEVWRLVVTDDWYQAELTRQAKHAISLLQAPTQWLDDVRHEAMLMLAEKLQRVPDLNVDPDLAEDHFAGWLSTIILRQCRRAATRLVRPLPAVPPVPSSVSIEQVLDVRWAVQRINDSVDRTVLALYASGSSLKDIAAHLNLTYGQARRRLLAAMHELRRLLESNGADASHERGATDEA